MIRRNRFVDDPLKDGILEYGHEETLRSSVGRKEGTVFTVDGPPLKFSWMDLRQRDFETYEGRLQLDSKKLKTFTVPGVDRSKKVRIDGEMYDITDTDTDGKYRYWYLERVKDEN